jgi:D-glycero-alpha-D-manno-heptose-7-phosphate kinase
MKISAKAPCRVDMAGGTIDIWPLYLFHTHAVTVNFAVDRYASCVLETRADARIVLKSRDLAGGEEFDSIEALLPSRHGPERVYGFGSAGGGGYRWFLHVDHRALFRFEPAHRRGLQD